MIDEKQLSQKLMQFGFSAQYAGYKYILHAMRLVDQDNTYLNTVTTRLYPLLAETYHVSSASVEHSIRTAIRSAWSYGDQKAIKSIFGAERPSNARFLAVFHTYLSTLEGA